MRAAGASSVYALQLRTKFPIIKTNKMKMIIALAAVLAVAAAAPQNSPDKDAVVLRYDSDNIGVDGYKYIYETSNGISQQETGEVVNAGQESESIAVRGQYSFTGLDGVTYTVTYVADGDGFRPEGAHLPHSK